MKVRYRKLVYGEVDMVSLYLRFANGVFKFAQWIGFIGGLKYAALRTGIWYFDALVWFLAVPLLFVMMAVLDRIDIEWPGRRLLPRKLYPWVALAMTGSLFGITIHVATVVVVILVEAVAHPQILGAA